MSLKVKLIPIREIFFNPSNGYKVLSCEPVGDYPNLMLNQYNNFTLAGTNLGMVGVGDEYELEIRENQRAKYPASYVLVGFADIDVSAEDIKIAPEQELKILRHICDGNQPQYVHEAYPDFVQMVLDGREEEIDHKKIYNVGPVRFEEYVNKIKGYFTTIQFLPIASDWGIENDSDVSKLIDVFATPAELNQALESSPYHIFFDLLNYSFDKSDRYVLDKRPDLIDSKERCEFACLAILQENENEGDTRIYTDLFEELAEEKVPECAKYVKDAVRNSERIYYDAEQEYSSNKATYEAEVNIAENIKERLKAPNFFEDKTPPDFEKYRSIDGFNCTDEQMQILHNIWNKNVAMLTGGAGCVDCDTEFFTGQGWKRIADYTEGDKVLQYNEDGIAELVEPLAYIKKPCDYLWHFETKYGLNQTVCEEHRIITWSQKGFKHEENILDIVKRQRRSKPNWNNRFQTSFYYNGKGIDLTDSQIKLMCAVICDGSFYYDGRVGKEKYINRPSNNICRFHIKKERKKEKLRELFKECNLEYREKPSACKEYTDFYIVAPRHEKEFTSYWYNCNHHQLQVICDNILFWDGSFSKPTKTGAIRKSFSTVVKETADFIQFAYSACGYRSKISTYDRRGTTKITSTKQGVKQYERKSVEYRVSINSRVLVSFHSDSRRPEKATIPYQVPTTDGYKYCFTVPSHMLVLRRKDCIFITGNCGKTSSMKAAIKMLEDNHIDYLLLAPTGIAMKRLKEATGRPASTIHMALACGVPKNFEGVVVIEESSMVSVHLLSNFLTEIGNKCKILFICDPAQLASISCGNIVQDIIDSGVVPISHLTKVFRYGTSGLATIATDTRNGEIGPRQNGTFSDYQFIPINNKPIKQILDSYQTLLDKYTKDDIMILSPFNKGPVGTVAINKAIQSRYNPNPDTKAIRKSSSGEEIMFKIGDKVINTHNEYNMPCFLTDDDGSLVESTDRTISVMNGDIGYVRYIKETNRGIIMAVEFDTGMAQVYGPYMNNLLLGYSVSVHRVQGSEAKAIIVITSPMHKRMLSSNLLYVADSRAKEQLIEIGDIETIKEGLKRHENKERNTWLCELLKEG